MMKCRRSSIYVAILTVMSLMAACVNDDKTVGYTVHNKSLIITESFLMEDYDFTNLPPWIEEWTDTNITSIYVSDGITEIGECVFSCLKALAELRLPDELVSVGNYAFYGCENLSSVVLPERVKLVGAFAFEDCKNLKNITLPDGLKEIGKYAFKETGLESVNIPASVISIEEGAFWGCEELKEITVSKDNQNYYSCDGVLFDKKTDTLITYPIGRKGKRYAIPEGTTDVADGAFYKTKVQEINIPNSVIHIGDRAFGYAKELLSVELPENLTIISAGLFQSCDKLELISIPDTVAWIEAGAFSDCKSLKCIVINETNMYLSNENGVIYDKRKKKMISYPSSSIEKAFIVPDTVDEIMAEAFSHNPYLVRIELPKKMSKIGRAAFDNLCNLQEIQMPEHLWQIDNLQFGGCPKLNKISIPDGIRELPEFFIWGHDIESISLPDSMVYIYDNALPGSLETLYYRGSKKMWEKSNITGDNKSFDKINIVFLADKED